MPLVIPILDFLILVALISGMHARLVYEIAATSLLLFSSTKPGVFLYSMLVLPGTIIHELSHWLMAEILLVRTGEIVILPDLSDESGSHNLGSVSTERSDPFRAFLIGVAPFLTGVMTILVLARLLQLGWGHFPAWQLGLIIYGIMVSGNSMLISREDRRTWPFILIFLALMGILIFKYYPSLLSTNYALIISLLSPLNLVLGVTAGLNLVMILSAYSLRWLIEKLTGKRIVQK